MRNKNDALHTDFAHIVGMCTKNTLNFQHKTEARCMPDHWQTEEGKVLWLQAENAKNQSSYHKAKVRLATPEELLANPEIRQGAIALVDQIEQYQQQLDNREAELLDRKRARWAPSVSNNVQEDELQFGQVLEQFLAHYHRIKQPVHSLGEKIKCWFFPLCLAVEKRQLALTSSRWFFPKRSIQNFKERFNHMAERRVKLLNRQLERSQYATIGFIPLTLESDCTLKLIAKKVALLNEIEMQSMIILIEKEVEHFACCVSKTPYHVRRQIQPLLQMVSLWHTLCPGKENEIKKQVILRLQAIRLHPCLVGNQPRVEGILRKAETLL